MRASGWTFREEIFIQAFVRLLSDASEQRGHIDEIDMRMAIDEALHIARKVRLHG